MFFAARPREARHFNRETVSAARRGGASPGVRDRPVFPQSDLAHVMPPLHAERTRVSLLYHATLQNQNMCRGFRKGTKIPPSGFRRRHFPPPILVERRAEAEDSSFFLV